MDERKQGRTQVAAARASLPERTARREKADALTAKLQDEQGAQGDVYGNCCKKAEQEAFYSPVIQERAWTSPIWYQPGVAGEPDPSSTEL